MKIAILTGASAGLGTEIYKALQSEVLDEIWIIARRAEKLQALADAFGKIQTKVLPLDLTASDAIHSYATALKESNPDVVYLFNNAGMGILGNLDEANPEAQAHMIDLNVRALTSITTHTLPYMKEGAKMINTCSIASFVPNARMTVYSATKAFVMSFSRSLRYELKKRKINVTAVCPGPMSTEFLDVAGIEKGASHTFDWLPRCNVEKTAKGGIRAAKKGRGVYTPHPFYKFYRILAKLTPHALLMPFSKT